MPSYCYKTGNVSALRPALVVTEAVVSEEALATAGEEEALREEEEAPLALEILIRLLRASIQDRITVIIVLRNQTVPL